MPDFKRFRKDNKWSQEQAAVYFGCGQSFISQIEKGARPIPGDFIEKALSDNSLNSVALRSLGPESLIEDYRLVPMYNMDARGGFGDNDEVDTAEYIIDYIPFKNAKSEDICIPVSGSSMIPTYAPGTVVLLHEISQWREFIEYGQIYVIILKDKRRLLKEVRKCEGNHKENFLCISHNPAYDPVELPKDMIFKVFLVTATYQKTTM